MSLTSLNSAVGSFLVDWNETHVHNPNWPPHAKFHNAQSMSMGVALGACGLRSLWGRGYSETRLRAATGFASIYWIAQLAAIRFPGTALLDPPTDKKGPQLKIASAILGLNALGYALERRRLRTAATA
ncbi:DUF6640 family protein [Amycolatopsis anabasis]|uniref:DUF6640 family protein n=1 Tax=Amycolatopsis anabasis TaxID=1840409 RepID=UPI00131E5FEC|nr:DUF6640 family protein [Amycolatopsis anabasis]